MPPGKFFIYTLAASVITFLGYWPLVAVCYQHRTLDVLLPELIRHLAAFSRGARQYSEKREFFRKFQFLGLPGHDSRVRDQGAALRFILLPLAHVEAPTAGSVLPRACCSNGTYGFLRLCLPLAPDAAITVGVPLIGRLS